MKIHLVAQKKTLDLSKLGPQGVSGGATTTAQDVDISREKTSIASPQSILEFFIGWCHLHKGEEAYRYVNKW